MLSALSKNRFLNSVVLWIALSRFRGIGGVVRGAVIVWILSRFGISLGPRKGSSSCLAKTLVNAFMVFVVLGFLRICWKAIRYVVPFL